MPSILAIDTSTEACSVALIHNQQHFIKHEILPRQHTQHLLPFVDELLAKAKISLGDVDVFAYGRGPGSFTGVRIAASAIAGLAVSQNKKAWGISTLQALAAQGSQKYNADFVLSAIDARMQEVYFAPLLNKTLGEESLVGPADLDWKADYENAIAVGTGWQYLDQMPKAFSQLTIIDDQMLPQAIDIALIAEQQFNNNDFSSEGEMPKYLRDNVTWDNKPKLGS